MLFQTILVSIIFGTLYITFDLMQKAQEKFEKNCVVDF